MARRIILTMLALISALLASAVIPLGLLAGGREQDAFREGTILSARTLAALAEENLADHSGYPSLAPFLARLRHPGDQVWVYNLAGQLVAGVGGATAHDLPVRATALAAALHTSDSMSAEVNGRLQVVTGVRAGTAGPAVGVVVLSRSTEEVDERLRVLWAWLAAVAAVGLLAGTLVAIMLARWVGRPLSALDAAAQRLGGGALDTRSQAGSGPPEVRRLAGTFNTMAGRLEALVHGNRAMMADVSHQLRTPLAALRLRLDLLSQDADEATVSDLAGAQDEIARLSRLVDGLLAVARAENVVVEPVEISVNAVIQDRAVAWRPLAEERDAELTTGCTGPVVARLGEGHLEQILDNLLANALEAVPAGGHVRVSAGPAGQGVRVIVADDGPGMSPQQQEAAFRRFASTTPGGAGLGLAIVHRLVTSNGGAAALSDTPGGGLTVVLDLPGHAPDRARRPAAATPERVDSLPFLNRP
ncbi:MAG TPA: HAMP domain-containing sensor histidine kinase [Streptosporangiaceae bacterium]|jgi:signal transduction histidine kinase|nr:HAMP domain-containing sensor histidine kinase [Streptosporangiaceae bacterium]